MGILDRLFGEDQTTDKSTDIQLQAKQMMDQMQLTGFQLEMDGHQTAAAMKKLVELDEIRVLASEGNPARSAMLLELEMAYIQRAADGIKRGLR